VGGHQKWLRPSEEKLREATRRTVSGLALIDVSDVLFVRRVAGNARNLGRCSIVLILLLLLLDDVIFRGNNPSGDGIMTKKKRSLLVTFILR
jgi:hypothetical protein